MERREHPVGEVLIIPMRSSTSLLPQDSARPQTLSLQPSSPPPPLSSPPPTFSLSSPQLQAEFLRRAPRAASPDNDSARHQNLPHKPSPPISPSVSPFSSPPPPLSSPPPPLSLSSPQLQAEFLRRAPRAASPDNDSARHQNLPHKPSPPISPSVSPFSSPPPPLSSPPPPLSLSSPQLQAEFLRKASRGLRTVSCDTNDVLTSPSSTLVSPFTSTTTSPLTSPPQPLSPSMPTTEGCATLLSLSSPELLTELCQSQSRPMKHVSVSKGLTTVFSGRGKGVTVRLLSLPLRQEQPTRHSAQTPRLMGEDRQVPGCLMGQSVRLS
ncbi:proline-rich receptor-like protein kinase PERK9 isoform X5 [Coregonus clupeaformis]|uniref:proline-rich receptor-like protein kinase PERK9 isoform X5 n=1 Tax=Coregonus clupeaformis TaxID=59861 RepID=UPI001E1C6D95|nr:proline-rich receptor-like protein kinase PERK9 isoform X5 [Coregonus clupeaformis]